MAQYKREALVSVGSNWAGLNKLIGRRALIPLIAVMTVAAIVVFPDQREWRRLGELHTADALAAPYLRLLVEQQPGDAELKLRLIALLIQQGKWDEAQGLASSIADRHDAIGQRARLALLDIHLAVANTFPASAPQRHERLAQVFRILEPMLKETLPASTVIRLAETSLALNRPDVAARVYERLANSDSANGQRWILFAARSYEASGEPAAAGVLYHTAYLSGTHEESKAHALKALAATMQTADGGAAALRLAEVYIERYPSDAEILKIAIGLAFGQSDSARARMWGRKQLALGPQNAQLLQKQLELELALKDVGAALELAQRLVKLQPENLDARRQLTRIAEWAGQPALAAEHYAWLARSKGSGPALDHALRLSRQRADGPLLIEMTTLRSQLQTLSVQELSDVEWTYGRAKNPQGFVKFLQSYLSKYPDERATWERLAQAQEKLGLLEAAAATMEKSRARFGASPTAALYQAGLLMRQGDAEAAFTVLRHARTVTPDHNVVYWQLYGNLAWDLDRAEDAVLAYRKLWQGGKSNLLAAERLVISLARTNQPVLAITTAEQGYQRFREPRLMFLALETATQRADWERLKHLLNVAAQDEAVFARTERYWLLKAHSETHAGRKLAALASYDRALEVNPASKSARVGWLWLAVESGDKQELPLRLREWRTEAGREPAYWGAYAAALLALNRPKEALPWFERQARAKPDDYLWLLTYADALQRSGQASDGWQLRRHVLLRIRREGLSTRKGGGTQGELALQRAYASLVNDFVGADAGGRAIQALLGQGPADPRVREMLIAYQLSQENYGAARYWLLRAHSERQATPAWQQLAVAFADDDLLAVERLLDEQTLAPNDRIQALRRLGRDEQALKEAREYASGRQP